MDSDTARRLKEIRAAKIAADPEGVRARKRDYDKRRREAKRDELLAAEHARRAAMTTEQREAKLAYGRAWRAAHPDKVRAYNESKVGSGYRREWARRQREQNPEKVRRSQRAVRIKAKYGISIEDYEARFASQGGRCAICGRAETMAIKGTVCTLAIDHDAATGRVRGLLCVNCNMAIGGMKHDLEILRAAIAYLGG